MSNRGGRLFLYESSPFMTAAELREGKEEPQAVQTGRRKPRARRPAKP